MQTLKEILLLPITFLRFVFVGIPGFFRDLTEWGERHEAEQEVEPEDDHQPKENR